MDRVGLHPSCVGTGNNPIGLHFAMMSLLCALSRIASSKGRWLQRRQLSHDYRRYIGHCHARPCLTGCPCRPAQGGRTAAHSLLPFPEGLSRGQVDADRQFGSMFLVGLSIIRHLWLFMMQGEFKIARSDEKWLLRAYFINSHFWREICFKSR